MPRTLGRRGRNYDSPRVSFASQRKGADAFQRICFRLGRQPSKEILADLRDHGALVLDVQLCRDLEPVLLFLREAPPGIHEVKLFDGCWFFGADASYQEKLQATRQRMPQSVLRDQGQLYALSRALCTFCAQQRHQVAAPLAGLTAGLRFCPTRSRSVSSEVLELTGLPLGQGMLQLLSRCLAKLPSLQRLFLGAQG
ncbi:unnamed protein product [Effrenium voratum]|nr:unnamed protein product [Effrenium voratum]